MNDGNLDDNSNIILILTAMITMLIIMMTMTTFEVSDPVIIRKYLHGNNENDDGDNDDLE